MIALVRDIPSTFATALCATPPTPPIDVARARTQHAAYVAALGIPVTRLAADDTLADCCFIEDTAVIADGIALITRPGAPSRRAETTAVETALTGLVEVVTTDDPATLDGGDCMRVGATIFVGRSARTNDAGITRLYDVFRRHGLRVEPVDLPPGILHLKSVCAPLGADRITLAEGTIAKTVFGSIDIIDIPSDESYAANVLAVGDRVLVAAGHPRTRDKLSALGLNVVELDTSELRKADGALTCLSLLV